MNTSKNNWYVITGAPYAGKTTIIEKLRDLGYAVVLEAARVYIDEEIAQGKTIQEIRKNESDFQRKVLEIKIDVEKKKSSEELIFWDRGIPDSLAYCEMLGMANDIFLQDAVKKAHYKKVFLLEPLSYEKDYARIETEEQQQLIHNLLRKAYTGLGHTLIEVKKGSIEERLDVILKNL